MYTYEIEVTSIYDGDTLTGNIDLGFNIKKEKVKLRLARIDTPEIRTKDLDEKERGYAARDWLRKAVQEALDNGKKVLVETVEKGKYGRWIAELYVDGDDWYDRVCLNDRLVEEGHAVYREY